MFGAIHLLDEARLLYEISIVAFWAFTWGAISSFFLSTFSEENNDKAVTTCKCECGCGIT